MEGVHILVEAVTSPRAQSPGRVEFVHWGTETPFLMSLLLKDTTAKWVHVHSGGRWNGMQVLEGMLVREKGMNRQ